MDCQVLRKARREDIANWRRDANFSFDGCLEGRRIEDVVWNQAVHAEAAVVTQQFAATGLLDMTNAFESALLCKAWAAGIALRFPLEPLRFSLKSYCFERRLRSKVWSLSPAKQHRHTCRIRCGN